MRITTFAGFSSIFLMSMHGHRWMFMDIHGCPWKNCDYTDLPPVAKATEYLLYIECLLLASQRMPTAVDRPWLIHGCIVPGMCHGYPWRNGARRHSHLWLSIEASPRVWGSSADYCSTIECARMISRGFPAAFLLVSLGNFDPKDFRRVILHTCACSITHWDREQVGCVCLVFLMPLMSRNLFCCLTPTSMFGS